MDKRYFISNLLVPAPEYIDMGFRWMNTIRGCDANGNTEMLNIFVFNTSDKAGIKPILEYELKCLYDLIFPEEVDVHNMAYIESVLRQMEDGGYEHTISPEIQEVLLKITGKDYRSEEVIYLRGIADLGE